MLSIISLTSLLALESLIFCMVENWTYLDAICNYVCLRIYGCWTEQCLRRRLLGGHNANKSVIPPFFFWNYHLLTLYS